MTQKRQELGKDGEELACAELESRGYAVLERRYRTQYGEIDVIAKDGDTLAFVEVRRKSAGDYGFAAESVTRDKQRRIVRMALDYLARSELVDRCPVRFDVVAIDDQRCGPPQVTVFTGAFDAW
jgi:putative endonuclease